MINFVLNKKFTNDCHHILSLFYNQVCRERGKLRKKIKMKKKVCERGIRTESRCYCHQFEFKSSFSSIWSEFLHEQKRAHNCKGERR